MRKLFTLCLLTTFYFTALPVGAYPLDSKSEPSAIRITPPAPVFADAERQAELARRRTAVASQMADNSVMVLFSAEPKLYTNDVDYVFRQENNLYYLTNLKQANATLIIKKAGGNISYSLFVPKRDPRRETWNGKMYSSEDVERTSGLKDIKYLDALEPALKAIKEKSDAGIQNIYLLLPESEADSNGLREFRQENDLSKTLAGYKVINAQPMFADLRHVKGFGYRTFKKLEPYLDIKGETTLEPK